VCHAQMVKSQILRDLDAIPQDQLVLATRSLAQTTSAKTAQWTNLPTQEPLLVSPSKLVRETMKSEVLFKTVTDAMLAQMVKSQILRDLDAIPQDQLALATRSSAQTTSAKTAHWTNLPTQVLLLVTKSNNVKKITKSEVMFKAATDAMLAHKVKSQILRDLDAILQDQLALATRSLMPKTDAKPAQPTNLPTMEPLHATQFHNAQE